MATHFVVRQEVRSMHTTLPLLRHLLDVAWLPKLILNKSLPRGSSMLNPPPSK